MCNCTKTATFYNRLFAKMYDPFMKRFEQEFLLHKRQKLLQDIQGNVMEIGCGTGINFSIYNENAKVIACEPSAAMLGYAYERLEKKTIKAEIELVHAGIGDAELENYVPANGFDAIVCTLVLCTVPDQEAAILDIKKWLKPSGKLYILEHIRATTTLGQFFQNLLNPVQKVIAEGCNLNRATDKTLRQQGFQPEWESYFKKGMPFYEGILGLKK